MKDRRFVFFLSIFNMLLLCAILAQGNSAVAQTDPTVVRARLFEVLDSRGTVRAQIKVESESDPDAVVLRLRDANGNVRVKLGATEISSGLVLSNDVEETLVHLLSKQGNTTMTLTDKNGRQRIITP